MTWQKIPKCIPGPVAHSFSMILMWARSFIFLETPLNHPASLSLTKPSLGPAFAAFLEVSSGLHPLPWNSALVLGSREAR